MDRHTPEQRSKNMAAVKSTGSKEEIALGKAMWKVGLRYRKNDKTVFGKPDFTFKKYKVAVFVDSEFFHGKDWETRKKPVTNAEFWEKKITRNIQRDKEVNEHLLVNGWKVLRFWSNDIKKNLSECVEEVIKNTINP
ncbi:very short patch repair endonuclease [Flavobacterium salilacus subsp. salilacus]|uniref:very short patch repair endonuclease n=1 Tax=Flavobacterium TaxID=237 RepID=UPI001074ABDF|nr:MULTISPECIES: very short patch repair endonuclease [Flavobacterium]KAF2515445.1 very short patch repair endonuclease [Flavobacterium salilacus subsp. salilacus]MBE1615840.1 very short patch repair endonuclease [Flavobacterium sp. SaA2.13]